MAAKALETCEQSQAKQPDLPYRAPPSITSFLKKAADKVAPPSPSPKPEPVADCLADRKSHLEAFLCSFNTEHDLSLPLAPELVFLAQELSKDPSALNEFQLERTNATYKLKYGVHLCHKEAPFKQKVHKYLSVMGMAFTLLSYQ